MISLSPEQSDFLVDDSPMSYACTGRGGGKTFCGATWSMMMALNYPKSVGLIGASNPTQLHAVCVRQFTSILDEAGVEWVQGENPPWYDSKFQAHVNCISIENGSQILIRSFHASGADRSIRGLTLGWAWLDESRELEEEVYDIVLAALRDNDAPNQIRLTSTPNGRDWQWRRFIDHPMKGSSWHTWTSDKNRHLPKDFVSRLKDSLDEDTFRQEVLAEVIDQNLTRVFRFDRKRNSTSVIPQFKSKPALVFSLDLNVQPMCGTLALTDGDVMHVVKEVIVANDATTDIACAKAIALSSDIVHDEFQYLCDEAGLARSTRGTRNDADIMRSAFARTPNTRSLNGRGKPGVIESVNHVNGMLAPASGRVRLTVDPSCKVLINDMESMSWLPGEPRRMDKSDRNLSHSCDSLRYAAWATCRNATIGSFSINEIKTFRPAEPNNKGSFQWPSPR